MIKLANKKIVALSATKKIKPIFVRLDLAIDGK
jgi:hypothetical protein